MSADSPNTGRFVWFELMTTDPVAARDFYTQVVGWEVDMKEGEMPYTEWRRGDEALGGLMELPEQARAGGAPAHWMAYVQVPDTQAVARRAQELGGQVLTSMRIPKVGEFAVLQDPQGAVLAAYTPERDQAPPADAPGSFAWQELCADDSVAAMDWYGQLFGWVATEVGQMMPGGAYRTFSHAEGQPPMGAMYDRPPQVPAACWVTYIRIADLDDALVRVRELGGQVLFGPIAIPEQQRIAQCRDPQGAMFTLIGT